MKSNFPLGINKVILILIYSFVNNTDQYHPITDISVETSKLCFKTRKTACIGTCPKTVTSVGSYLGTIS